MSEKFFTTYEEQIAKLKSKKLTISDKDYAISILKRTSYFALINAYKPIFKDKHSSDYKDGICFEDIFTLYSFDEELRVLLLKNILIIERQMKSLISYYFCEKFGHCQEHYLNVSNYNLNPNSSNASKISTSVSKLISILESGTKDTAYPYIRHNIERYQNVPLWVLINSLSFGNISKMYSLSLNSIKQKICNEYKTVTPNELENMLSILTKFRNVCAHNERLYNYKTKDTLPKMNIHNALNLPLIKNKSSYTKGVNDIFSIVIIFKHLLSKDDFNTFFEQFETLISDFKFHTNIVSKEKVFSEMGLPLNWRNIFNI